MSKPKATHSVTPIRQKSKTKFIVKVAKSKVPQAYTTRNTQGNRTQWGNEMKVKIIKDTFVIMLVLFLYLHPNSRIRIHYSVFEFNVATKTACIISQPTSVLIMLNAHVNFQIMVPSTD